MHARDNHARTLANRAQRNPPVWFDARCDLSASFLAVGLASRVYDSWLESWLLDHYPGYLGKHHEYGSSSDTEEERAIQRILSLCLKVGGCSTPCSLNPPLPQRSVPNAVAWGSS